MNTCRLIATFPLNGDQYEGYIVHIIDEGTDTERYRCRDITGHYYTERFYPTIGEAIALCLRNSGWGEHNVTPLLNGDGT